MVNQVPFTSYKRENEPLDFVIVVVIVVLLVVTGPLTVGGSLALLWWMGEREEPRDRWFLGLGALVGALWLRVILPDSVQTYLEALTAHPGRTVAVSWIVSLPLIPLGAVLMSFLKKVSEWSGAKTLAQQVEEAERESEAHERRQERRAMQRGQNEPSAEPAWLPLGTVIKGDHFPPHTGVSYRKSWVALSERLLDQHVFILGSPGAGKSETIKRLSLEILTNTNRDLFLVDGKGESELATSIRMIARQEGRGHVPIFQMGMAQRGAVYNGFQGDAPAIYSRLAEMIGVSEAEGNARFYADSNSDLLQLLCYAPGGPPRSFREVRERLTFKWLKNAWADDPLELETIQSISKEQMEGLQLRLRPLMREFDALIRPEGFSLDETHCAIFSIRTQSVSHAASRLIQFLIEDLKDWIGKRQQRDAVLIIDEFGSFGNKNIIKLLSLARSARLGIILATQDVANLGDDLTKQQILATTRTKFLMASDFPEEIATLAGTIKQIESSMQHDEGTATGMGSARLQDTFAISMNEAARLEPGQGFLIRQRFTAKVQVKQIPEIEVEPEEEEVAPPVEPPKDEKPNDDEPDVIDLP